MDLQSYFKDMHAEQAKLEKEYPDGIVHVTSLFHRDRNSTPGSTLSATTRNASRVITDGTHRRATAEEIKQFQDHQQAQLVQNTHSEQLKKKQYIVVMDDRVSASDAVSSVAASLSTPKSSSEPWDTKSSK